MNAVQLKGVRHRFGATVALHELDLALPQGAFVVLLGPSGSGKTTLLNIMGGFLEPTAGRVHIGGLDVTHLPPARRPTTTVFQDYALFPHLSVGRNVGFGLELRGVPRRAQQGKVAGMLELVGLAGMEARRIHELSGGQRQRVALARALIVEPSVLLLDEPLGALDLKLRRQMQGELRALQRRTATTFVHVTHDQDEAMGLADLIILMNEGRVEDCGPPERVYLRPKTRFAATFMGESNVVAGCVSRVRPSGAERQAEAEVDTPLGRLLLNLETPLAPGARVEVALRPEQLRVLPLGAVLPTGTLDLGVARLEAKAFFGSHHAAQLSHCASLPLRAHLPQGDPLEVGAEVRLAAAPRDFVVLQG